VGEGITEGKKKLQTQRHKEEGEGKLFLHVATRKNRHTHWPLRPAKCHLWGGVSRKPKGHVEGVPEEGGDEKERKTNAPYRRVRTTTPKKEGRTSEDRLQKTRSRETNQNGGCPAPTKRGN